MFLAVRPSVRPLCAFQRLFGYGVFVKILFDTWVVYLAIGRLFFFLAQMTGDTLLMDLLRVYQLSKKKKYAPKATKVSVDDDDALDDRR